MSNMPIKVRSVLGCDDIREEANGKLLALGLFGPSLSLVPEYTTKEGQPDRTFRAHFLLAIDILETGDHQLEFRLQRSGGGGGIARMQVSFAQAGLQVPFAVGPMTLRVPDGETELTLSIKSGDAWKRLASWQVETADVPTEAR